MKKTLKMKCVILFVIVLFLYLDTTIGQNYTQPKGSVPGEKASEICRKYSQEAYQSHAKCPIDNSISLILGGQNAQIGEFPHMVQIGYTDEQDSKTINWNCAGSLISKTFIITAAHCTRNRVENTEPVVVRAGVTDQSDTSRAQTRSIAVIFRHPEFNQPPKYKAKYNDIALIKVDKDFDINDFVRPACLYTQNNTPQGRLINPGWGSSYFADFERRSVLLKIYVNSVSNEVCNETFYRPTRFGIPEDKLICAGVNKAGIKDGCQQESGGPLLMIREDTETIKCMYDIVGVSSFGYACGLLDDRPSVYTRVSHHIKWIEDKVWNH